MDGVRETLLDWFEVETADSAHWKAATPDGDYDVIDCGSLGVKWSGPTGYEADDWRTCATIKAAKDECENHAQRITSALAQPSGVVSDELRELLDNCIAVLNEFGASEIPDWDEAPDTVVSIRPVAQRRGLRELRDMTLGVGDFIAARHYAAALTAALASPVSEGEIRADERERLAKLAGNLNIYNGHDSLGRPAMISVAGWLRNPARSLTNGEG